jgi:hypothetical protein
MINGLSQRVQHLLLLHNLKFKKNETLVNINIKHSPLVIISWFEHWIVWYIGSCNKDAEHQAWFFVGKTQIV